jgi:hypothetical protein
MLSKQNLFKGNNIEESFINNLAIELNTSKEIHEADHIFNFLYNNPVFNSKVDAINYYFRDGLNSCVELNKIIKRYKPNVEVSLLEFASGYGCLTRHFNNVLSQVKVISSDIHPEANTFVKNYLNASTIQSTTSPSNFPVGLKFDFVFALSFFSHMPINTWGKWFETLAYKVCKKNGFFIFTTQGEMSQQFFPDSVLDRNGYWFKSESEQLDLDGSEYGNTIVTFDFVNNIINSNKGLSLVKYDQGKWWNHQDLYIVKNHN